MIIGGIDPGLSGALGVLRGRYAEVHDLPVMGTGAKTMLNGAALAALLRETRAEHLVIERQQAFPAQGRSSTFKFGTVYGQILGVVEALGISHELVSPGAWKRDMKVSGGDDKAKKERARQKALELFPGLYADLSRKMDHNRAEALLLARWWAEKKRCDLPR